MPQFLSIHGAVNPFTQQGVEKLNDMYTHYYFHSTNHRESGALKQLLLKKNRLEYLANNGFERSKEKNVCFFMQKVWTQQENLSIDSACMIVERNHF